MVLIVNHNLRNTMSKTIHKYSKKYIQNLRFKYFTKVNPYINDLIFSEFGQNTQPGVLKKALCFFNLKNKQQSQLCLTLYRWTTIQLLQDIKINPSSWMITVQCNTVISNKVYGTLDLILKLIIHYYIVMVTSKSEHDFLVDETDYRNDHFL